MIIYLLPKRNSICNTFKIMTIENILLNYRRTQKLSQKEVADLIGVSQVTLHNWESGKHQPLGSHLNKIYEICQYEIPSPKSERLEVEYLKKMLDVRDEQIILLKDVIDTLRIKH